MKVVFVDLCRDIILELLLLYKPGFHGPYGIDRRCFGMCNEIACESWDQLIISCGNLRINLRPACFLCFTKTSSLKRSSVPKNIDADHASGVEKKCNKVY